MNFVGKLLMFISFKNKNLFLNGFWLTLRMAIISLTTFALSIAFANFLSPEKYGVFRYIMSLAAGLSFLNFYNGTKFAIIESVAKGYEAALKDTLNIQLKLNSIFFIFFLGLSFYYYQIENNLIYAISLLIVLITYPLDSIFNYYSSYLIGKKEYRLRTIYNGASTLIHFFVVLTTLILTDNILIIILVFNAVTLIPDFIFTFFVIRKIKNKKSHPEKKASLFHYAKHLSFTDICSNIALYIDKIILFNILGPIKLAIYTFADNIPSFINTFFKENAIILLPELAQTSFLEIKKKYYLRIIQSLFLGFILALIYFLLAPYLFKFIFPQYLESLPYTKILALNLIFSIPIIYSNYLFQAKKFIKTIYLSNLIPSLIKIVFFLVFPFIYGIWGFVIAQVFSNFLTLFFVCIYLWEKEKKLAVNSSH